MKNRIFKTLSLMLACAMTAGCMSGCANTAETGKESSDSVAESGESQATVEKEEEQPKEEEVKDYKDVEFRISWWGGDARNTDTTTLVETFEKDYQNLKIDVEYAAWGDYWTKLTTQATGGEMPDVIQMDYTLFEQYYDNGLIIALDEYVESGALDFTNVIEASAASGYVDGKLVGVVTGTNAQAFFANPAVLEEAGVTLSQTPTLDEFIDVCKKVYDTTGSMALPIMGVGFMRVVGGEAFSEDGKNVGFTEEMLLEYWDYLADGYEYGYFPGPDVTYDSPTAALADGTLWEISDHTNKLESFEKESGLDLMMFATPCTEANPAPCYIKPTMAWSISSTSENKELAVEFLDYFVNNPTTYDITGMDRGLPISSEIQEYLEADMTPAQKEVVEYMELIADGHVSAMSRPDPAGASEAKSIFNEYVERVRYADLKREDFPAAAKELIEKMNSILSAAK